MIVLCGFDCRAKSSHSSRQVGLENGGIVIVMAEKASKTQVPAPVSAPAPATSVPSPQVAGSAAAAQARTEPVPVAAELAQLRSRS